MSHGVVFLLPRAGMGPPWLCAQFHSHSIERVCVGFHAICAIPPGWMLWMRRHVAQQRSCRQKAYRLEVSAEVLLRLQRRPLHLVELMREFAAQDPRRLLTYRIRSFL